MNGPCPCGSGKKFAECHGQPEPETLHVVALKAGGGRVYKVIGVDDEAVRDEVQKAFCWLTGERLDPMYLKPLRRRQPTPVTLFPWKGRR